MVKTAKELHENFRNIWLGDIQGVEKIDAYMDLKKLLEIACEEQRNICEREVIDKITNIALTSQMPEL